MSGETHEFCRECGSWFCPHAAAWMYENDPKAAAAWEGARDRAPEPEEPAEQELLW